MPQYDVLVDSDVFVGLMVDHDAHHQRVRELFSQIEENKGSLVTTNYVITETASMNTADATS